MRDGPEPVAMIGAFAKIFSSRDRVGEFTDVPEGTQVTAFGPEGGVTVTVEQGSTVAAGDTVATIEATS